MKGGHAYGLRVWHIFVVLVSLVLMITLLWTWEQNPLAITLHTAQEWYHKPLSGVLVEAPINSTGDSKLTKREEISLNTSKKNETKVQLNYAGAVPVHSVPSYSPEVQYIQGIRSSLGRKVCNYAKGRWVADKRRPLYSGFGCKKWLSPMWSCRMTPRPDFSYEGYRWQPENCDMPEFDRSAFLRKMQDKTIAFVGDSLGRQQFQSLMCMATGGEESPEVEDVGWQYGLVKRRGALRPDGWAYRFPKTNTTILYYWSASLCYLEPLNMNDPLSNVAMHLDRPAAFLQQFINRFHVLILNTGHHWNRGKLTANRWIMYVGGKPNEDKRVAGIVKAKNLTIYSVAKWVDTQLVSHPQLKAFFTTISPRHFVNGDWNSGGSCDNTIPLSAGSEVVQDGSSDLTTEGALRGMKIKMLDITALSQLRDEAHMSRYTIRGTKNDSDCLHWCLPGVPDTWNELLVSQI
ncbi:hypothetical protein QN277_025860 [Acacia crassicarpa]|uniref:Trichome birefringence-like N-terminal domain-containing protein n=1 Tax=Acacia crassicarpa TaxID=499986 RepID=A0AAE1K5Q4_9FABA|nr:hypothetical protein QN277_025860 [Acacia crassicarpa]